MSFVPLDEFLSYAGETVDIDRAEYDLEAACDKIRDYLGQTIDLVEDEAITVYGTNTRAIVLPELPVVDITSVVRNGDDVYPDEAVTDYHVDAYGVLWRDSPSWWPRYSSYTVTYSHGYAPADVPAILKVAAFKLAMVEAGMGIRQESVAGYSVTYESPDAILSMLDRRIVKRVPTP
jgi:hypothetical protein